MSDKMENSVVVTVEWRTQHQRYRKSIVKRSRFMVHDPEGQCAVGDLVRILETRPISKFKRWRILEILSRQEVIEIPSAEELVREAIPVEPTPMPTPKKKPAISESEDSVDVEEQGEALLEEEPVVIEEASKPTTPKRRPKAVEGSTDQEVAAEEIPEAKSESAEPVVIEEASKPTTPKHQPKAVEGSTEQEVAAEEIPEAKSESAEPVVIEEAPKPTTPKRRPTKDSNKPTKRNVRKTASAEQEEPKQPETEGDPSKESEETEQESGATQESETQEQQAATEDQDKKDQEG